MMFSPVCSALSVYQPWYPGAVRSVILTSNIFIQQLCQNTTTTLSPRLLLPHVPLIFSCSPPLGTPSSRSSPLAMHFCLTCSVDSSADLMDPTPFICLSVWIMGSLESADGVRALAQRSPHSSVRRLWRRVMRHPILQRHTCSTENGVPHPSQSMGRRRILRPILQRTLYWNSWADISVSPKKLGITVNQPRTCSIGPSVLSHFYQIPHSVRKAFRVL